MSLTEGFTAADLHDSNWQIFSCRVGASLFGSPFDQGRLAVVRPVGPADEMVMGGLYLLVDGDAGEEVPPEVSGAVARLLGASADVFVVDQFQQNAPCRRRLLPRPRWQPRASIDIK